MALYVAICLIAVLSALQNVVAVPGHVLRHVLGLVWGTTVGLALAHVFAFRIAGRLVHRATPQDRSHHFPRPVGRRCRSRGDCQCSGPICPDGCRAHLASYPCVGIIGVVGYLVARGAERGRLRAVLFGLAVLVAALAVAALKHALASH
jgi:hypothetical protein